MCLNAKVQKMVQELNVIDDAVFEKMAEDKGFCEEMLSTILRQKVTVKRVVPQNSVRNLQGRSVRLDALCVLEDGRSCEVEVQRADDDDHMRRVRYNASCITANITSPGTKFEEVPDVVMVFISKFDMFGEDKTVYHIDRIVRETNQGCENGLQEIYVNTKINDGTDIAELMHIFKNHDVYNFQKFPRVSQRKKQILGKEDETGEMNALIENFAKEYAKEYAEESIKNYARETARSAFLEGDSFEKVKRITLILDDEELRTIYEEVFAGAES